MLLFAVNWIQIMKRKFRLILPFIVVLSVIFGISSCQKNPFWVGEKEYVTFIYNNSEAKGPTITSIHDDKSPFIYYESSSVEKIGNGRVRIKIDGVSVRTINKIFNINGLVVHEKEDDYIRERFSEQTEVKDNVFLEKSELATVIVIDFTTSMKDEMASTKEYAKGFIDQISDSSTNGRVAVVFFSGRNDITATPFYPTAAKEVLKKQIDDHDTYGEQTAVLAATYTAIKMLDNLSFSGSKSLILFSDGPDTDSDQPDSTLTKIQDSNYDRIAIGIRTKGFKKWDLQDLATAKATCYIVDKPSELKDYQKDINTKLTAKYDLVYERSDQTLNTARLIKYIVDTDKIE